MNMQIFVELVNKSGLRETNPKFSLGCYRMYLLMQPAHTKVVGVHILLLCCAPVFSPNEAEGPALGGAFLNSC